jgi:hypothetical protein
VITSAYFSKDRRYRYWLLRHWDESLPVMANIGCNPSTADETENDPTIRKDIGFAKRLGFGGLLKLNVGAFRATDPKKFLEAADPFGKENRVDDWRVYLVRYNVEKIVVAWGSCIGRFSWKAETMADGLAVTYGYKLWNFGVNPNGTPRHTLMLPYSTPLQRYFTISEARALRELSPDGQVRESLR